MNKNSSSMRGLLQKNANNVKLIVMFLLSVVVLYIATHGAFSWEQL